MQTMSFCQELLLFIHRESKSAIAHGKFLILIARWQQRSKAIRTSSGLQAVICLLKKDFKWSFMEHPTPLIVMYRAHKFRDSFQPGYKMQEQQS